RAYDSIRREAATGLRRHPARARVVGQARLRGEHESARLTRERRQLVEAVFEALAKERLDRREAVAERDEGVAIASDGGIAKPRGQIVDGAATAAARFTDVGRQALHVIGHASQDR